MSEVIDAFEIEAQIAERGCPKCKKHYLIEFYKDTQEYICNYCEFTAKRCWLCVDFKSEDRFYPSQWKLKKYKRCKICQGVNKDV